MLYRHADRPKRILLLGVGGGAVILQLQELIAIEHLYAVEIDEQHLDIAERWFGVSCDSVSMIHADAVSWVHACDERPFDLIIDDLFGHSEGEPERACELNHHWLQALYSHLAPGGLLIANCVNARELQSAVRSCYRTGFRFGHRWSLPAYENSIAVLSHEALLSRVWSGNLQESCLSAAMQRQARTIRRRPVRGLKSDQ